MNQLSFSCIEEDMLAATLRRYEKLCGELAQEMNEELISPRGATEMIKLIERGLRDAYRWN